MKKLELELKEDINRKNVEVYIKYLTSCSTKSLDTMETTYKIYLSNMKIFMMYLKKYESNRILISKETLDNFLDILDRYVAYCRHNGNNNRTIRNKVTAISSFYTWATKRGIVKFHPFKDKWDIPKITSTDKRRESYFLTMQNIWKINYVMELDKKKFDIQDRLLFNLFLDSGCRISAGHGLKLNQLNMEEGCFEEVREKEGYIVSLFFFQETKKLIHEWLKEREKQEISSEWLFLTKYNGKVNQMSKETIRSRIRKIGKIVGIEKLYPHSIRKTIVNLISKAGKADDGAMLANHKNSAVTQEYYIQKKSNNDMKMILLELRKKAGF